MKSRLNHFYKVAIISCVAVTANAGVVLLWTNTAQAISNPVHSFGVFDEGSNDRGRRDDRDEVDRDRDSYRDRDSDRDSYRGLDNNSDWDSSEERRIPRDIGKIEIDLVRPSSVSYGIFTSNFLLVVFTAIVVFSLITVAMIAGRRQFNASSGFFKDGKAPTNRSNKKGKSKDRSKKSRIHERTHYEVDSYAVLELPKSASNSEIRARYHHLAKSLHSDKLANLDLPEEVIKLTTEKFQKIKEAYEDICAERKM